jgi:hypothetical protein
MGELAWLVDRRCDLKLDSLLTTSLAQVVDGALCFFMWLHVLLLIARINKRVHSSNFQTLPTRVYPCDTRCLFTYPKHLRRSYPFRGPVYLLLADQWAPELV